MPPPDQHRRPTRPVRTVEQRARVLPRAAASTMGTSGAEIARPLDAHCPGRCVVVPPPLPDPGGWPSACGAKTRRAAPEGHHCFPNRKFASHRHIGTESQGSAQTANPVRQPANRRGSCLLRLDSSRRPAVIRRLVRVERFDPDHCRKVDNAKFGSFLCLLARCSEACRGL